MPADSTDLLAAAFAHHLKTLPEPALTTLGRRMSERARELGLIVLRDGESVDIGSTLTPEIASASKRERMRKDAALVLDGVLKTARHLLQNDANRALTERLFTHFTELEAHGLKAFEAAEDLSIARVDWFEDASGEHFALELNATIPAMPGYSDAAAVAWIETLGEHAGLSSERIAQLVAQNDSNAEQLRRSLLAHSKSRASHPSIALLHRPGDSQLFELRALQRHFVAAGHDAWLATPDDVALEEGVAVVSGKKPDILYRHIFARRMPPNSALAAIARGEATPTLQNPINGHLEVKGLLAELSRHVHEGTARLLGLSDEAQEALARVVPWTRVLSAGRCVGPDGESADLESLVGSTPDAFVLKRSWDYGGKSVLIGRAVVEAEGLSGWEEKVRTALAEPPGSWVVQRHIDAPKRRHLVLGTDSPAWEDVYVDISTYTASGSRDVPGGGVARFARSGIVNIAGGGGVAPLVHGEVASAIGQALSARPGSDGREGIRPPPGR